MSCTRGSVDEFFFVKWVIPEVSDAEKIVADVRRHSEERGGLVRYIAIIGAAIDPPSEEVRASMKENIDALLKYCESLHLVVEGKGFRRAMVRSIGTGIFLLSKNRGRTFAHDTVEHALERAGADSAQATAIMDRARELDLLNVPS